MGPHARSELEDLRYIWYGLWRVYRSSPHEQMSRKERLRHLRCDCNDKMNNNDCIDNFSGVTPILALQVSGNWQWLDISLGCW